jgi:hypothetical protein
LDVNESELIREMYADVKVLVSEVAEVKVQAARTNGLVAQLQANDLKREGALNILKWLIGLTLALVSAGAAVAGVVLALVARGG